MVRAKFLVTEKTEMENGTKVSLMVVTGENKEDERFFELTPFGILQIGFLNEETAKQFTPGKRFYVDFTPAE